ncbi:MAG: glycosyltransferase family 4 protein [Allosphingosinicella sp.]
MKSVLYIDMAYTVQAMRRRQQGFWEARHSGDYFGRVWGLHPIADRAEPDVRSVEVHRLSRRQMEIQGVALACGLPKPLAPLDFLLTQRALFKALADRLRRRGASLVYATDAVYGGLFGYWMARRLKRPLIVAVYGNWDELWSSARCLAMPRLVPSKRIQDAIIRFVLRRADHVVVGNRNNFDYVLAHGAVAGRTSIISTSKFLFAGHLADADARRQDRSVLVELGLPVDARPLICVGRLVEEKLPDQALEAMIRAAREDPRVWGLLAGEGPMRDGLQARIDASGLSDRIKLTGAISQELLARLLPHCVVLSPLTGMALLEAGLAGAPIVAYALEWQAEFIDDGRTGFLVPPGDAAAMGERALRIVRDPGLSHSLSTAVRAHAMRIADREAIFAAERAMYDGVIARHRAAERA